MKTNFIFLTFLVLFISCKREYKEYTYYPSGKVEAEISYFSKIDKETKQDYSVTRYYENGGVAMKQTMKNSERNGDYWEYYENGLVRKFMMYRDGVLHGVTKLYSEEGEKRTEALFLNGLQLITVMTYPHDDTTTCYYYLNKGDDYYGFLSYDSKGCLIKAVSAGCEVTGADTILEGGVYSLAIKSYALGIKDWETSIGGINTGEVKIQKAIFGEFDSMLNFVDSTTCTTVFAEKNNKVVYSFKPAKLGYNVITGVAYYEEKNNDLYEYEWPFYKLFYVKGKGEK